MLLDPLITLLHIANIFTQLHASQSNQLMRNSRKRILHANSNNILNLDITSEIDSNLEVYNRVPSKKTKLLNTLSFDWACMGVPSGFRCGTCDSNILCLGGKAYVQKCPIKASCTIKELFSTAVCYNKPPGDCMCRGKNELLADPYSPFHYLECTWYNQTPLRIRQCPNGHSFNQTTSTCQILPAFAECSAFGTVPHLPDCRWYYTCELDDLGKWRQLPRRCEDENQIYSSILNRCEYPNYLPARDICAPRVEGRKANYICTLFGVIVTKFFPDLVKSLCYEFPQT